MSKVAKTYIAKFSTAVRTKTKGASFVKLAQKHITKVGTKEAKTVSRDIDTILYGAKSVPRR